eukprot:GHVQ01027063.1.p1 GENE.GHVQ01027063.1~~GHVQ01027063.1.p1  ORF type:complete len:540 (+),score=44.63 GHVQ01027063.1:378-1997(+)
MTVTMGRDLGGYQKSCSFLPAVLIVACFISFLVFVSWFSFPEKQGSLERLRAATTSNEFYYPITLSESSSSLSDPGHSGVQVFSVRPTVPEKKFAVQKDVSRFSDTSRPLLPGYCAVCSKLKRTKEIELPSLRICPLVDVSPSPFPETFFVNELDKQTAWNKSWSEQAASFPIVRFSPVDGELKILSPPEENNLVRDNSRYLYYRYLLSPGLLDGDNLAFYSSKWRVSADDVSSQKKSTSLPNEIQTAEATQNDLYKEPRMAWYKIARVDYRSENNVEYSNTQSSEFLAFAKGWEQLIERTTNPQPDVATALSALTEPIVSYSYGFEGAPGEQLRNLLPKFDHFIKGQRGVVVGTLHPWVEFEVLRAGAGHVTTAEYLDLSSVIPKEHPYMSYAPANSLLEAPGGTEYLGSSPEPGPGVAEYDFALSFSSLEHSGLGRYGDPLNPDGDIFDMHILSCVVKPGGLAFIGLPLGGDCMQFNLHRYYGVKRLQLMFECWRVLHIDYLNYGGCSEGVDGQPGGVPDPSNQPWMVVQNLRGCAI